jgi:hypothetical protein
MKKLNKSKSFLHQIKSDQKWMHLNKEQDDADDFKFVSFKVKTAENFNCNLSSPKELKTNSSNYIYNNYNNNNNNIDYTTYIKKQNLNKNSKDNIQIISKFPIDSKIFRHYIGEDDHAVNKLLNNKNILKQEDIEYNSSNKFYEDQEFIHFNQNTTEIRERGVDVNDQETIGQKAKRTMSLSPSKNIRNFYFEEIENLDHLSS